MQRLGVWAISEEELKPKKGARNKSLVSGGLKCEDPEVRSVMNKDMRGALNQ